MFSWFQIKRNYKEVGDETMVAAKTTNNKSTKSANLKSEITDLTQKINALSASTVQNQKDILEFSQALELLKNPATRPYISTIGTTLSPLDAIAKIQEHENDATERQKNITRFEQALSLATESVAKNRVLLQELKTKKVELESELDWASNYLPHCQKYKLAFTIYQDAVRLKIRQCEAGIVANKKELNELERFALGEVKHLSKHYLGSALDKIPVLQSMIKSAESRLLELNADLQNLPPLEDDQRFRKFVISRVNLDKHLKPLLTAQSNYISALQSFIQIGKDNADGLENFNVFDLSFDMPLIALENNKIVLKKANSQTAKSVVMPSFADLEDGFEEVANKAIKELQK